MQEKEQNAREESIYLSNFLHFEIHMNTTVKVVLNS